MLARKYNKLLKNQSGFTLIELIIGITIMLLIMGPIASSLNAGIKAYQYNLSQSQNTASARELLNVIADELRYAKDVSIATGSAVTLPSTQITYTVGGQSRMIYTIVGTPSTTNTIAISYNGTVHKNVALNNLQSIAISRNAKQLIISAHLNNHSYSNSPTIDLSTTVIMQNM